MTEMLRYMNLTDQLRDVKEGKPSRNIPATRADGTANPAYKAACYEITVKTFEILARGRK